MSERKFYALGTASQVPTRRRNHNGYFLKWDNQGFLFDPGEGTQRQMIFSGVSAREITKIFITHFHGDHCLGLPGILQRISLDRVEHPVEVYFPASGRKYFDNLRNASIYYNTATIKPMPISEDGEIYADDEITIHSRRLEHTVDSRGYRFAERDGVTMDKEKIQALGIMGPAVGRLKKEGSVEWEGKTISLEDVSTIKKGKALAFIMDTRLCDSAVELSRGVDVLVAESTYMNEHQHEATDHGHMTAADAATLAKRADAGFLVLTHFSQRYGDFADFAAEAKPIFSEVAAVRDGDSLDIRKMKLTTRQSRRRQAEQQRDRD